MTDKLADAQKSTATVSPVPARDRPWMFRTYSGHSSAKASNALYRTNLERGQTGLSIAFDLPTQTGYDGDHVLAKGEVGKVGVPVSHLGDMEALFEGLPLDRMNTSMTINAPAAWMLSLYIALGERQGVARADLQGTTQNDIIKEYLSRGTYIFPPEPSLKLTADVASFTYREVPKWNPLNVCSYHLQEAGATPEQELSFALATAIAVLDAVRDGGQVPEEDFARVVGRISFFVNSGIRLVTELSKMRAFAEMWDDIARNRYGVTDEKLRRFRYGVQVNSLGLTEQQPENNVYRILLEMLPVVLSRNARARAVQLPAWNEALGLPRPWDQQWSLRLQQIVAYETDLLEFGDIFDGSRVIAEKVEQLKYEAEIELKQIENMGGAVAAIENSYMKRALVSSNAQRLAAIESGDQTVIGVNKFTEAETSPLTASDGAFLTIDGKAEEEQIALLQQWRAQRDSSAVKVALEGLATAARDGSNIMEPSIAAAHAGVTTGEWAETLRGVFGEFRAPTGVSGATGAAPRDTDKAREHVQDVSEKLGRRMKMLLGKPGLDGHSNGAEQIAVRARDAGVDVVYEGIRLTPRQIVSAALEEGVHVIGLSILSGSHATLAGEVMSGLKEAGLEDVPVIVGGIIPEKDAEALLQAGISRVYTPKDFDLGAIIDDIAGIVENANNL
ncbi:MAG: protein meaA [Rhodospirillales bacterium]|nr:protein meaA [Rhodospirillales bacterium]